MPKLEESTNSSSRCAKAHCTRSCALKPCSPRLISTSAACCSSIGSGSRSCSIGTAGAVRREVAVEVAPLLMDELVLPQDWVSPISGHASRTLSGYETTATLLEQTSEAGVESCFERPGRLG